MNACSQCRMDLLLRLDKSLMRTWLTYSCGLKSEEPPGSSISFFDSSSVMVSLRVLSPDQLPQHHLGPVKDRVLRPHRNPLTQNLWGEAQL